MPRENVLPRRKPEEMRSGDDLKLTIDFRLRTSSMRGTWYAQQHQHKLAVFIISHIKHFSYVCMSRAFVRWHFFLEKKAKRSKLTDTLLPSRSSADRWVHGTSTHTERHGFEVDQSRRCNGDGR